MSSSVLIFIAACLFMMLCLNIILRVRVYKVYNRLARNRVDFSAKQMLNKKLLETEVIPKYPGHEADIRTMANSVQLTIRLATVMLAVILLLGWYLIKNR